MTSIRVPDTISKLSPGDTYPVVEGTDVGGFTDLKNEVNSNTSKIETNITNISNLVPVGKTMVLKVVGDTPPDFTNEPHGNYFVTARAMTTTLTIKTPNPTGGPIDGAILTIFNESPSQAIRLEAGKAGDKIDSATAVNIPPDNFISLVYTLVDSNWMILESGYIPAARVNMANFVEQKLDADGKLHTEADLDTLGFLKGIKVSGEQVSNVNNAKWIHFEGATVAAGKTDQAVVTVQAVTGDPDPTKHVLHFQTIPERDQWSTANGSKFVDVLAVVDADSNGFVAWFEWDGSKWQDHNAAGVIMSDSNGAIPHHIKTVVFGPGFSIQQAGDKESAALVTYNGSGAGGGSITLDDGTTNVAGINTVEMKGIKISRLPTSPGGSAGNAEITAGMDVTNFHGGGGSGLATKMTLMPPLQTFIDPSQTGAEAVRVEIKHDTYEPMHAPSFLAYVKESTDVVGRLPQGLEEDEGARHKGALWFDDIISPAGVYIETDRTNKSYGIQEADQLDPNVSGGTDYLIAFRAHMRGKAPSDGFVRIYLYNHDVNPFMPKGYLLDKEGQPMMVQRQYKAGETLGVLDAIGIVNAKGSQKFQAIVEDSMSGDLLELTDRTEGCTGLMIQALKADEKTGPALLQFEADTNQNIEFSSHYLGVERMTLGYANSRPDPVVAYTAGTNFTVTSGMELINRNGLKVGTVDGRLVIQDDGTHMIDFNFGKVFTTEETKMLRGKVVTVKTTTSTKKNAARILAVKWLGKPDEYTKGIISGWVNEQPTFETDWADFGHFEIVENALTDDISNSVDFTVPVDANNYAIIMTTNDGRITPYHLEMKQFDVDVKVPFIGYSLDAPENHNEAHFAFDPEYKEFTQNTQGYGSLRYTINNTPPEGLPMPVGEVGKGLADITLDPSVNQVPGSAARGGEGAIRFNIDGAATITTTARLSNETGTKNTVTFHWVEFDVDGNATPLPDSSWPVEVPANTKDMMYRWKYEHDFEAGARVGLRALSDKTDGAFLNCTSDKTPMVHTIVSYRQLRATGDGADDPWGTLDLSQFEHVYTHELDGRIVIRNGSSAVVNFVIEPHMFFDVKRAIKIKDGVARPVRSLDYSYDYATHELRISLGETVEEARVLVGVYV